MQVRVDISRLVDRLDQYKDAVVSALADQWEDIALLCIEDVLSRTPSPEEEFDWLMWGGNSSGQVSDLGGSGKTHAVTKTGRSGKFSGDTDQRIRFIRTPGMWLQELVAMPTVNEVRPEAWYIGLGNVAALEAGSHFSWQNYAKSHGTHFHTSEYGVWSWFEYGIGFTVQPKFSSNYKLSPSETVRVWAMNKAYPAKRMYSSFDPTTFTSAVTRVVNSVTF